VNILYNRYVILGFKLVVFLLMSWFIADQLFLKNNFKMEVGVFFENFGNDNTYLFFLAILLMPLNWLLEAVKWNQLLKHKFPVPQLLKSILAGIALGFVTPGRGGEFIGRVLFLDEEDKAKAFYLSSIGGIAQTTATLMVGVICVYFWRGDAFLSAIALGLAIVWLLLYLRFDLLNRFISSNSFLQKYSLVINQDELPDVSVQTAVLLLSFLRFGVYLSQYVLLLMFFGVGHDFFQLAVYSGVFLLAQTFSPLMPLLDFSFRGGSALVIFSALSTNNTYQSPNTIAVLCSVTMVWLINLAIPAITGYFFILKKKMVLHAIRG
jgi:hypothetical protein